MLMEDDKVKKYERNFFCLGTCLKFLSEQFWQMRERNFMPGREREKVSLPPKIRQVRKQTIDK